MRKTRKNLAKKKGTRKGKNGLGRTKTRNYKRKITRQRQSGGVQCGNGKINIKNLPGVFNPNQNFVNISDTIFNFLDPLVSLPLNTRRNKDTRKALAGIIVTELRVMGGAIFDTYCKLIGSNKELEQALYDSNIGKELAQAEPPYSASITGMNKEQSRNVTKKYDALRIGVGADVENAKTIYNSLLPVIPYLIINILKERFDSYSKSDGKDPLATFTVLDKLFDIIFSYIKLLFNIDEDDLVNLLKEINNKQKPLADLIKNAKENKFKTFVAGFSFVGDFTSKPIRRVYKIFNEVLQSNVDRSSPLEFAKTFLSKIPTNGGFQSKIEIQQLVNLLDIICIGAVPQNMDKIVKLCKEKQHMKIRRIEDDSSNKALLGILNDFIPGFHR
jgi:hypothetical protein